MFLVRNRGINRLKQCQRRLNNHQTSPNNHLNSTKRKKLRAYVNVCSKPTCICGNRRETRMYTRLQFKKSRTGRKVHKIKENRQAETNFTPIKHYQAYMPPDLTRKQERKRNSNSLNVDRTTPKGQLLGTPQQSRHSVMERNSYGLGYHNR